MAASAPRSEAQSFLKQVDRTILHCINVLSAENETSSVIQR